MNRRVSNGGRLIDRAALVWFSFDGRSYQGHVGDTLASALLANGVSLLGRSFKYHRPRGVFGAGVEEPNALVTVGTGDRRTPNLRATQVELYDGLVATSQNRWPSLRFDFGALAGIVSAVLPAGFYYKTFMWPGGKAWLVYEWFIRRAAGLGQAPRVPDPDDYAHQYAHFDLVIVGAGTSGIASALAAGRAGANVLLVEDAPRPGGSVLSEGEGSSHTAATVAWCEEALAELAELSNVRVMTRTTAFGIYDQGSIVLSERVTNHVATPDRHTPRERLWYVRAREIVLATGCIERPLVFAGNDRPGVMLASAARGLVNRYGVRPASRAVIFTNNDSAYVAALELKRAGVEIVAVVDARSGGPATHWREQLSEADIPLRLGSAIAETSGRRALTHVSVAALDGESVTGEQSRLACDGLFVSGGWTPSVHLFAHVQGPLAWDETLQAFVPSGPAPVQNVRCAGTVMGAKSIAERIRGGFAAGLEACGRLGIERVAEASLPPALAGDDTADVPAAIAPLWQVRGGRGKAFVDFQNDVTAADVGLAVREGYRSVEHLKRYTTLGMGTDQGRLSNINGLAQLAAARGESIPAVGFTTFRPPFSPVTLGLLSGDEQGEHLAPSRLTPLHDWHVVRGANMVTVGRWWRPEYYPRSDGETKAEASYREVENVRQKVGMVDVSTLGKIEIQGVDAAEFLERVYVNRWKSLKIGRARYGLMLRDDGIVMDDGTTTRIGEQHYYMTTTTGAAELVMGELELHAKVSWPELDVQLVSVSDQWGAFALAGPCSRELLAEVTAEDVSNASLPFMGYLEATIDGVNCRIFRLTFSGELAYEVHVPAGHTEQIWRHVLRAGEPFGVVPYGTEAMAILRIEKGHVVGGELDGRTTAADLGFGGLQRPEDSETRYVGQRGESRQALTAKGRLELVGLRSVTPTDKIPRGGHLLRAEYVADAMHRSRRIHTPTEGHMTSVTYSPTLKRHIGLAMIRNGRERMGERLTVASPLARTAVAVEVVDPVFVDPEGVRPRG